jgi:hypothetical protein
LLHCRDIFWVVLKIYHNRFCNSLFTQQRPSISQIMPASAKLIHFPIALLLLLGLSHSTQATSVQGLNRSGFMAELVTNPASGSLFHRAILMAQAIADPLERIQALTSIAHRLEEVHQPAKAKQIIEQVMQIAHSIPVESTRNQYEASRLEEPFIAISAQIADAGFIDQALALVRSRISTKLNKGLALNKIAVAVTRQGNTQRAKKLLSEAVRSIKGASEDKLKLSLRARPGTESYGEYLGMYVCLRRLVTKLSSLGISGHFESD